MQIGERRLDGGARGLVEGRGRLVEQQHAGLQRQGRRQHHPLLLADREPVEVPIGETGLEAGQLQTSGRVELRPARRAP